MILTSQYMAASERINLVGAFAADRQIPIGHQFVPVQFDPCLHQPQLLARQLAGENIALRNADRSLELGILGMTAYCDVRCRADTAE